MKRTTLAFEDADLEGAFLADRVRRGSPRQFAASMAITLGIWLAFGGMSARLLPVPPALLWGPVAVGVAAQVAALGLALGLPLPSFQRAATGITAALALVAGLAPVYALVSAPDELVLLAAAGPCLYLFGVHGFMGLRFVHALAVSWLLVVAYATMLLFGSRVSAVTAGWTTFWLVAAQALGMRASYVDERQRRLLFLQQRATDDERRRADDLLRNVLPEPIAERLKAGESPIADAFAEVTILFADIVGFTELSARLAPVNLVALLDRLFTAFDGLAGAHGLEKIKTIGDAYMVVGGLPVPRADHAEAVVDLGLSMRDAVAEVARESGRELRVRIGVHTGPVVAGVIGTKKFAYDLWGDAVNTASRMESHGVVGEIQVSDATRARVAGRFELEARGAIPVKGKGEMETWLVRGRARG